MLYKVLPNGWRFNPEESNPEHIALVAFGDGTGTTTAVSMAELFSHTSMAHGDVTHCSRAMRSTKRCPCVLCDKSHCDANRTQACLTVGMLERCSQLLKFVDRGK